MDLGALEALADIPDSAQLFDGRGVVLYAEVYITLLEFGIGFARPDYEQGGGLLAAFVAAGSLSCLQGCDKPLRELALRRPVGARHFRDHLRTGEDVPLAGESVPDFSAGPVDRALAGVA